MACPVDVHIFLLFLGIEVSSLGCMYFAVSNGSDLNNVKVPGTLCFPLNNLNLSSKSCLIVLEKFLMSSSEPLQCIQDGW